MPKIFISIPCVDGFVYHELALRLIQWSHELSVKITFYPYLLPLDNARNKAVKDFLDSDADYFFHIDNDIVPPHDCLEKLLGSKKDIIAPVCFTLKPDDDGLMAPMPIALKYDKKGECHPYYGQGVEEVDVITGGCHLIKRGVFEKIKRPYFFSYDKDGLVVNSEDFVFSKQAKENGYKLFTHFGLFCKHYRMAEIKNINDLMVKAAK